MSQWGNFTQKSLGKALALLLPSPDQPNIFTLYRDVCNFILNEGSKTVNYFMWVMEKARKKEREKEIN